VQADDRNCYGHPAPEVVARYEAQDIALVMITVGHVGLFYLTILWARPSRLDKMFWWCVVYTSAQTAIFQPHSLVSHTMP
jgi:hypothetical protein